MNSEGIWTISVGPGATSKHILGAKLLFPVAGKPIFFPSWAGQRLCGDLLLSNTFGSGGISYLSYGAKWNLDVTGGLRATSRSILGAKLPFSVTAMPNFVPLRARQRLCGDLLLPNTFEIIGIHYWAMVPSEIWMFQAAQRSF